MGPQEHDHGVHHPLFARVYAKGSRAMEREMGSYRARLLAGLTGTVVEIGAGNGLNFPHYPDGVTRVVAVEPEPHLRTLAEQYAPQAKIRVEVVDGVAERLPLPDASADAVVTSLVLCSVGDQRAALAEVFRVLRPGGELRFFEHVRADGRRLQRVQRALDATVWPRLAGGCHTYRDTGAAITDAGFSVEWLEAVRFPDSRLTLPTSPHILGVAIRPATGGQEAA